jgi:hypothetical protein
LTISRTSANRNRHSDFTVATFGRLVIRSQPEK